VDALAATVLLQQALRMHALPLVVPDTSSPTDDAPSA
jgi:hypothetical protein